MSDDIAIKVDHVSKEFKLPHEKQTSIKGALVNLSKTGKRNRSYERQQVLKDVSFEINKGEFFGIVGRNGSGKSTLLKLLAGIYKPTKGGIQVNGKLTPFIELGVGFNHELTGRENVFLNGALLGFNRNEMAAMYDDIVSFAELEKFMDQKLKNYSSGMQVRLAFSIAIRAQSDILLLDEVLAVGDAAFQKKCFNYFMKLKRDKRTVILVTHDMSAIRQYCDKAIMIDQGQLFKSGSSESVAQAYQRLFARADKIDSTTSTDDEKRWGTGKLLATTTAVKVNENDLTIEVAYTAQQDLDAPILGFTIYGPSGNNILEGNTLRMKVRTTDMRKGEKTALTWTVPNIFATGTYSVSVACCDQSTTEFYDWLNDAATFIIDKEGNTAGVVDPKLTVKTAV